MRRRAPVVKRAGMAGGAACGYAGRVVDAAMTWLKRRMPRGLYGRAALILLLPIITIQLLVGTAFIQRFFDDVARQMTVNTARPLAALVRAVDDAPDAAAAARVLGEISAPLRIEAELGAPHVEPYRAFYDISGRAVAAALVREVDGVRAVDLGPRQRRARVEIATRHGPMVVTIPRRQLSPRNPHQLLVIMVFAGIVLTAVSYVFLKNQLRPVHRLAEAATAFGRGRHVEYRPGGATEMRAAGQAFLDMRSRIERAGQQRTLMLSGVSHDLRTPLTRMRLALSLIDDPEAEALLGDVAEMEAMIDGFLDYARMEAVEEARPTDPAGLLEEVAAKGRRAGHAVEVSVPPGAPEVPLRRDVLGRALSNLAGNAARHAARARLSLRVGETAIVFVVEDDGPGIPETQREAAMRPFERLEGGRNRDAGGGVGLGLAIAGDAARLHGGTLRLGTSLALGGLMAEIVIPR